MGLRGDHPVYFFLVAYVSGLLLSSASLFLFGWVAGLALPVILVPFLLKRFWAKGGLLYWVALLLGGLRMGVQDPVWDSKHYLNVPVQEVYLLESRGEAEERAKTYRVKMEVVAGGIDSVWREMRGLVQVYLPKGDTLAASVRHGDRLWAKGRLSPIEGFTGKDGEYFDYGAFMAKKGVYAQMFLARGGYLLDAPERLSLRERLFRQASALQDRICDFLDRSVLDGSELAVAKSLVLGVRGEDAVEEAYRDAGIVHILAVSGMHLSIFACLLAFLFRFLGKRPWQRWLRLALMLSAVWGYSFLTGLCASVVRAACMSSFVALGRCMGRDVSTLRSLAASALFLLVVDPGMLWDLGFLLSYLAVAGLVLFNPLVVKVFKPKSRLGRMFWELTAVSLSAQLATFPVILHVFGTFSTYFLLANWVAVPLGNIALPLGIAVAALSLIGENLALWLVYPLDWVLRLMDGFALEVSRWPMAVGDFSLSLLSVILFYAFLLFALRCLSRRNVLFAKAGLFSLWFCLLVG